MHVICVYGIHIPFDITNIEIYFTNSFPYIREQLRDVIYTISKCNSENINFNSEFVN